MIGLGQDTFGHHELQFSIATCCTLTSLSQYAFQFLDTLFNIVLQLMFPKPQDTNLSWPNILIRSSRHWLFAAPGNHPKILCMRP